MSVSTTTSKDPAELLAGADLERRLEELLHQDAFAPPAGFVAQARSSDASLHAEAELDPDGFWAEQARTLRLPDRRQRHPPVRVRSRFRARRVPAVMAVLEQKVAAAHAQEVY